MSKNKLFLDLSKNYFEELEIPVVTPKYHPKIQSKKLFLDCSSLKEKKNIDKKKEKEKKQNPIKKSNSSIKYKIENNSKNLYTNFALKTQNPKNKIVINCSDENKKSQTEKEIISQKKKIKIKILSNVSTRKSSDASPVEPQTKNEIFNFNKNFIILSKNLESLKKNEVSIKSQNNGKKVNLLKNKFKLKSNEKKFFSKRRESIDINHPSVPPQLNYFLNSNSKGNNTSEKKENLFNNTFQRKIEPLRLFDYEPSSSSSSSSSEEINDRKKEFIHEEKEFIIDDSKFKISSEEISDELNESLQVKINKKNIFEKKLKLDEKKEVNQIKDDEKINLNIGIKPKEKNNCKEVTLKSLLTPETNKKIISSYVLTKHGINDGKIKINQDSYIIKENIFSKNFNIYGIFDGHGENGHLISKFISNFMNNYYDNKLNYILNIKDKQHLSLEDITNIFLNNYVNIINKCSLELDQEINTKISYEASLSGATSVMIYLIDDTLICSNVGDSQCFLFNCSEEDLWSFESLSKMHLPSDEHEKRRIIEKGGVIHPYYGEDGIFEGPDRIYAKNKVYPGLCMSRIIGDLEAKKIGVISEPDIILKKIENNSKFLVIGSDGLWDVIKPYDIIRMVRPYFNRGDIEGACQIIMKKAVKFWEKRNEERDDITIIIVFKKTPNNNIIKEKIFI